MNGERVFRFRLKRFVKRAYERRYYFPNEPSEFCAALSGKQNFIPTYNFDQITFNLSIPLELLVIVERTFRTYILRILLCYLTNDEILRPIR